MALEPPLRKVGSQTFDTIRPMNGYEKSLSFMTLTQTVFGTDQKNHREADSPPPTSIIGLTLAPMGEGGGSSEPPSSVFFTLQQNCGAAQPFLHTSSFRICCENVRPRSRKLRSRGHVK